MNYYGNRLVAYFYPQVDVTFFLVVALLIVWMALRRKLSTLARASEIIAAILAFVLLWVTVFLIAKVKPMNILPGEIPNKDIHPVAGVRASVSGLCYIMVPFFIGSQIKPHPKPFRSLSLALGLACGLSSALIFATVGSLGYEMVLNMDTPFIFAIKQLMIVNSVQRMEALVTSALVFSDFVLIAVLVVTSIHLIKTLAQLENTCPLLVPVLATVFLLAASITPSSSQMVDLSTNFLGPGNLVMLVGIPAAALAVYWLRVKRGGIKPDAALKSK